MKFAGKGKLKIEITCMKIRYRLLIIFLQLFVFFSYIGCFIYLTYKADKELIFVDIPVKYTKGDITGKEQRSFDSIIESHPKSLQCYLEPDFRKKQEKYTPFVYSGQREKSSVYYLNLVSYVKYKYGFLWIFLSIFF